MKKFYVFASTDQGKMFPCDADSPHMGAWLWALQNIDRLSVGSLVNITVIDAVSGYCSFLQLEHNPVIGGWDIKPAKVEG